MMSSYRVLHLRASRFVGGPERQILRYVRLSESEGVTNAIATFVGDGEGQALLEAARAQGTEVIALPYGTARALLQLIRTLRASPFALLCTHGYKADILGIMAGRMTRTPVASFLRGWTAEDFRVRAYESMNRILLRFTDRIVCLSEVQRQRVGAVAKTRVVINAIEPLQTEERSNQVRRTLRDRLKIPHDSIVVASAGRLSPEKGTAFFLEAAKRLHGDFPRAHFVIFGDGALRHALEQQAQGLLRLHFAGHAQDFQELVPGIDLLVNPSLSEEMPNVVLEAMAAGVPVVATSVGGVPEIAGNPATLALVQPGNADSLAKAMEELLLDSVTARELGNAGQQRAEQVYSPRNQRQQLLALLAEFVPAAEPILPLPTQPFISIVVPVRNEAGHLGEVLRQLEQQDYPFDSYEVLVVDGNSTDKTRNIAQEFARDSRMPVRLLENPRRLSSAGRNVGALASRGEIVAFIDGHCSIPSTQMLPTIVELFRKTGAGCLCRPQPLLGDGNTPFQDALAHTRATIIGHGSDSTIFDMEQERLVNPTSSGAIYRSEVFKTVGMYDEDFDACEDVEFNFRVWQAGFSAFSSPRIAVEYSPRASLGSLWKQLTRYGRGRYRFMRKHPSAITIPQLMPAAFVLSLLGLGVAAPFSSWAMWTLGGVLILYSVVVLAFAIRLSIRYGWHHLLISPAVYACIHGGLGAGFLLEALLGRQLRRLH